MAKLSKAQISFIKKMELSMDDLFDASGLNNKEYQKIMKEQGKLVAYGVTPCGAKGHTLRTRKGHCVQCNTANLDYLKRMSKTADVYVAWSQQKRIAKVGLSVDAYQRLSTLNEFRYGGIEDWQMKLIYTCENAGQVETATHQLLREYSKTGLTYWNGNVHRDCTELFQCNLKTAMNALETAIL